MGGYGCRGDYSGGSSKFGSFRLVIVEEEEEVGRSLWGCLVFFVVGWFRWVTYGVYIYSWCFA